jgi:hypothetical protein
LLTPIRDAASFTSHYRGGMMTSLDEYLRGQYLADGAFLDRLYSAIVETVPIFHKHQQILPVAKGSVKTGTTWPYAVSSPKSPAAPRKLDSLSASTHCMILFALESLLTRQSENVSLLLGKSYRPAKLRSGDTTGLKTMVKAGKDALLELLDFRGSQSPLVESSTYGKDDPFTLTWLAEVVLRMDDSFDKRVAKHRDRVAQVADAALHRASTLDTRGAAGDFKEVKSSFLSLRRLHLARTLVNLGSGTAAGAGWLDMEVPRLWTEFDDEIHRQLSYSAMGDARFDPSELAFAFEGALLTHPTWVSPSTVDKVFESLRVSKERQPYWRPITPLLANDRGHVLFLVSIEVANSVLRSCEILDGADQRLREHFIT